MAYRKDGFAMSKPSDSANNISIQCLLASCLIRKITEIIIIIIIILLSFYMHIFAFPFSVPIFSPTTLIIPTECVLKEKR